MTDGGFALQVGKFEKTSVARCKDMRRIIILKLFSAVILDTPVLTGRLRANWQLGKKAKPDGLVRGLDPSGAKTLAKMQVGVDGEDGDQYLVNNLPYAARIEYDGWSHTKAPMGMVRRNVARIAALVQQASGEAK